MFFQPRRPGSPSKGLPVQTGIPGLNLNLSVDHIQVMGTLLMMGLNRRPGFKEEMAEFMLFMQKMQEAAETISVQMESVHQEYAKVKAKMQEPIANGKDVKRETSRQEGTAYVNPLLQHLFRLMSY
ncbi:hypothetical protein [Desulfotomaculum sp. 1211_IL3151]|uniref:hypothetical protein n=1 Tax=Desulfotomaculum sp. 1211_IL3151 TaxID=3084055 RepID=UPI002FDB9439